MRRIDLIVVHCTATPEGRKITVADVDRMHKQKGWKGIGYHYLIYLDGSIHTGRPIEQAGAHAAGHNAHSIGVCYVGGVDAQGKAKDTRTPEQRVALFTLLHQLHEAFPQAKFCGHRDLSPDLNGDGRITKNEWIKQCPCFEVKTDPCTEDLPILDKVIKK